MAILRSDVEGVLVGRVGPDLLGLVGLSAARDGTNPDLADPIGFALRNLGLHAASGLAVADADLAPVQDPDYDQLLDVAEYRLLATCRSRFARVRNQVGPSAVYWSEIRDGLDRRLVELLADLKARHGYGRGSLTAGVIALDVAETNPALLQPVYPPGA